MKKKSQDVFAEIEHVFNLHHDEYFQSLRAKIINTFEFVPTPSLGSAAMDVGYSQHFLYALRKIYGYANVAGGLLIRDNESRQYYTQIAEDKDEFWYGVFESNPTSTRFDCGDSLFDLVTLFDILGRVESDPMFFLSEVNRITSPGGHILITTPNASSLNNLTQILEGGRPNFHLKYSRSPYVFRQLFEYDFNTLSSLLLAGGFHIVKATTFDVQDREYVESRAILEERGFPQEMRGDVLLVLAQKKSPVIVRYPPEVYE